MIDIFVQVLRDMDAGRSCDLWALGCILFQMLVGRTPFRSENEYLTFQEILNHPAPDFCFPKSVPGEGRSLIELLLLQVCLLVQAVITLAGTYNTRYVTGPRDAAWARRSGFWPVLQRFQGEAR